MRPPKPTWADKRKFRTTALLCSTIEAAERCHDRKRAPQRQLENRMLNLLRNGLSSKNSFHTLPWSVSMQYRLKVLPTSVCNPKSCHKASSYTERIRSSVLLNPKVMRLLQFKKSKTRRRREKAPSSKRMRPGSLSYVCSVVTWSL